MKEEVLHVAIEKVNEHEGVSCMVLKEGLCINDRFIDAEAEIVYGHFKERYFVEIKKKLLPEQIPLIQERKKEINPLIIIADYITPNAKKLLRLNDIPYIDTAGNMYFRNKHVYINIQTGKTNREKLKINTRAFNRAGLRVIYQFLIHPEYLNKPYRFIGEQAGVTIATVGLVIKDLLNEKYVIKIDSKRYKFNDRVRLFEEWVKEYSRNLKPKLRQKRYRWLNKNESWRSLKLPKQTYWGGESAAEVLTGYLFAEKVEIYTGLHFEEVAKILQLLPDKSGDVTVIEHFWKNDEKDNTLVEPILVYADLFSRATPRNLETANKVYKQYVQNQL